MRNNKIKRRIAVAWVLSQCGCCQVAFSWDLRALGDTYKGRGTYQLFNINEKFNEVGSTGLYRNRVLIRADCEEQKRQCVCVCVKCGAGSTQLNSEP